MTAQAIIVNEAFSLKQHQLNQHHSDVEVLILSLYQLVCF